MSITSEDEYKNFPIPTGWQQIDIRNPKSGDWIISWATAQPHQMTYDGFSECRIIQPLTNKLDKEPDKSWIWTC